MPAEIANQSATSKPEQLSQSLEPEQLKTRLKKLLQIA